MGRRQARGKSQATASLSSDVVGLEYAAGPDDLVTQGKRERRNDLMAAGAAALLAAAVFLNTLGGEFVYDDDIQIVKNQFIQDGRYFWQAMTSDVWAFKGHKDFSESQHKSWSNYWRPTFILWLMLNYRLFGLGSTLGWHVTNILLHMGVVAVAFGLLRHIGVTRALATAIVLIFAVHPAHVESVAWISGSPDLLLAISTLGALWCVLAAQERRSVKLWAISVGLFLPGAFSKESGVLVPVAVFAALFILREGPISSRAVRAAVYSIPFAVIAAVYFFLRRYLLGQVAIPTPWALRPLELLVTAPSVFAFYLRQSVFPLWIGPSYPLRAVVCRPFFDAAGNRIDPNAFAVIPPEDLNRLWSLGGNQTNIRADNFWIPVIASVVGLALLIWLARRDRVRQIGLLLFLLPLAPAMNVNAFRQEEFVHDRYLYLSLLGLLMILVPAAAAGIERVRIAAAGARRAVLAAAVIACVPLAVQTWVYNRAWASDAALWTRGIQSDPGSTYNLTMHGRQLYEEAMRQNAAANKQAVRRDPKSGILIGEHVQDAAASRQAAETFRAARETFDRVIKVRPVTDALLTRAAIATEEGRFAEAEADLKRVLSELPDSYSAYERLALVYDRQAQQFELEARQATDPAEQARKREACVAKLNEAADTARTARKNVPHLRCAFTEHLAVILYHLGRKDEALRELESVRAQVPHELGVGAPRVLYRLALLYGELGRGGDAVQALREFMQYSATLTDAESQRLRQHAASLLAKAQAGPG